MHKASQPPKPCIASVQLLQGPKQQRSERLHRTQPSHSPPDAGKTTGTLSQSVVYTRTRDELTVNMDVGKGKSNHLLFFLLLVRMPCAPTTKPI